MRTLKTRSERSGLWEGRIFHPSGAIRDVGPRKMPVANGSAGGSFESLLKALARTRRKPPRGGASRGAIRERGQHERARVASGFRAKTILPRGRQ